jgi:hypothetical protein
VARSVLDGLRSLARYVQGGFDLPWKVSLSAGDTEGKFKRPFLLVALAGPVVVSAESTAWQSFGQPYIVHAYPPPVSSVEEAFIAAGAAQDQLVLLFEQGWGLGRKRRVPLYNYDGVSLNEASTTRLPNDYMRVVDLSVRPLQSPVDPRDIAAVADVRLEWDRMTYSLDDGELVQSLGWHYAAL